MKDGELSQPQPRILPPVPAIAHRGEVVADEIFFLMDRAADELNRDLGETYEVLTNKSGGYDDAGRRLPEGLWRVHLLGSWIDNPFQHEYLAKFWGKVIELGDELPAQSQSRPFSKVVYLTDFLETAANYAHEAAGL